jgi:hypothetical protein
MAVNPPADLAAGLLQIADLLERGNLNLARSQAQSLLERYPASAAVHALLGDIAAAGQFHREAGEWYQLSLRLAEDAVVRGKLERSLQAVERERLGGVEEVDSQEGSPARSSWRGRKTLVIALVGGVLVLLGMAALITHWLNAGGPRGTRSAPRATARPAGRPVAERATPTAPSRPADARPGRGQPTATTDVRATPSAPMSTSGVVRMTQKLEAPLSDRDILLTRSLAALTWPSGGELGGDVQAIFDPFTGYALITAQLPRGRPKTEHYQLAVEMAHMLAVAAIRSDAGVDSLTVRILAEVENENRQSAVLVAFRGNTNRTTLEYYLKQSTKPDLTTLWQKVFATTWWNPSVPAE